MTLAHSRDMMPYPLVNWLEWRMSLQLTQEHAAALIGYKSRMIRRWESGESPIPCAVGLACAAIAAGLSPWAPTIQNVRTMPK